MASKTWPISMPFGHKAGLPPSKKYLLMRQPLFHREEYNMQYGINWLLFTGRNFLNWKFRMIPLWSRILPIRNAKHRQNPVTVRGHGVPVYCNNCSVPSHLQEPPPELPFGCMASYEQKSIPDRLRRWDFCLPSHVLLRSAQQGADLLNSYFITFWFS